MVAVLHKIDETSRARYSIDIVRLSKRFRRRTVRGSYTTVKSGILNASWHFWGGVTGKNSDNRVPQDQYTHAIRELTLRIPRGASVGIIGQNGSGKSSLLKLIAGIYKPDTGSISIHGRIAALIELGAGFHPDFTGRENVYLAGIMHGLSRDQISERFEEIVSFAELSDVIDDPVRTYSSGMFMRLGFSIAVHTNPDILIIDEVLAVGDAAFVAKCHEKISQLKRDGKTLLLVTHDLDAVERWCDEALWLHKGEPRDRGDPRRVIDHYLAFIERGEERDLEERQRKATPHSESNGVGARENVPEVTPNRWGSREVEIRGIRLLNTNRESHLLFHAEDKVELEILYEVLQPDMAPQDEVVFGIAVHRSDGLMVLGTNTDIEGVHLPQLGMSGKIYFSIARLGLLEGSYTLDVAVHRRDGYPYDYQQRALTFAVRWTQKQLGVYLPEHTWRFEPEVGATVRQIQSKVM